MFSVGDWEGIELTEEQKLFAHELATLSIELKEQQLTLAKMRLQLLATPTSEMQALCDEHCALHVEPAFQKLFDPAMRLLTTVIDHAEMVELVGVARENIKKRVIQQFNKPVNNVISVLMGPLFVSLKEGDLSHVRDAFGRSFSLDQDSVTGFVNDNIKEVVPMLLQLAAQGVNVPILLFVAECYGLPTGQVKLQLEKLASEGLPRKN